MLYLSHWKSKHILRETKSLTLDNVQMLPDEGWGRREGEWWENRVRRADWRLHLGSLEEPNLTRAEGCYRWAEGATIGCAEASSHLQKNNVSFQNATEILAREELGDKKTKVVCFVRLCWFATRSKSLTLSSKLNTHGSYRLGAYTHRLFSIQESRLPLRNHIRLNSSSL